jgi:citrate lyase subunit alpha/citrate CoA-transferase
MAIASTIKNAAGRVITSHIEGLHVVPYKGIGQYKPDGRHAAPPIRTCAEYPSNGNKTVETLREALVRAGIKDGARISTHHHFRNGDLVAAQLFEAIESLGIRDIIWFPSAVFPCHAELLPRLESGLIHHIEGSLNGPVGEFASAGKMKGHAVLRSHGGRYRAIQDGNVTIDIAVIAAPSADPFGNMTGAFGPAACGGLGFAVADAQYANYVIAVTDNLVPFPCAPWQIAGNHVDQVVQVDRIGDPAQIVSGTT